ncbi:hypothetical protein E2C01_006200 [Portunus trituberculatus]|uniref:Uncharacterized protein n=1 Tax=Portunus trituberculatus TaxID=210409 RepID=A0A5B7CXI4_PORTR|nr:hypothetical protein [Portunus trituberculatus]
MVWYGGLVVVNTLHTKSSVCVLVVALLFQSTVVEAALGHQSTGTMGLTCKFSVMNKDSQLSGVQQSSLKQKMHHSICLSSCQEASKHVETTTTVLLSLLELADVQECAGVLIAELKNGRSGGVPPSSQPMSLGHPSSLDSRLH